MRSQTRVDTVHIVDWLDDLLELPVVITFQDETGAWPAAKKIHVEGSLNDVKRAWHRVRTLAVQLEDQLENMRRDIVWRAVVEEL